MRQYQIDRTSGCLVFSLIILILLSFATAMGRFLFGTRIGLVILGIIVIRHFWNLSIKKRQQDEYHKQVFEQKQKTTEEEFQQRDNGINTEDIVDVDYVEVVDLDKD